MSASSRVREVSLTLALVAGLVGCAAKKEAPSEATVMPPVSLVGTEWHAEDIGGTPVADKMQTSLLFSAEGNVSGSTGCNSFTGTAKIDGEQLSFTPLATTRKGCMEPLMTQEQSFLKAIEGVHSFAVDDSGMLQLLGAEGQPLMKLSRATP